MNVVRLLKLPQTLRNIGRIQQIFRVLIRHGFGDLVDKLHLRRALGIRVKEKKAEEEAAGYTFEQRIRMILEDLGPTFVKLGQIMATRPDLIPMSLVLELRKLQDDVPPFDTSQLKEFVETELGRPVDEMFSEFSDQPMAAASIAQVHAATLKDGSRVVLKVQRPGLEKTVKTDLSILKWLADLLHERIPESQQFGPRGLVEEFSRSLLLEIDFSNELYHLQKYADNFRENPELYVPKPYREFSTSRILTMELIEGLKVTNREAILEAGIDPYVIARNGTSIILQSIFEHGFFHADPHPGNFFIQEEGRIALIDFGMMGQLDSERLNELLAFLVSILLGDTEMMIDLFLELGLIGEEVNTRTLKAEVKGIIDRYYSLPLQEIDIGEFITKVFEVVVRHRVELPSDLLLVAKSITTIEGIAQEIYPEFDPVSELRPYLVSTWIKHSLDPMRYSRAIYRVLTDYRRFLRDLPGDLRAVMGKLKRGQFVVNVQSEELGRFVEGRQVFDRQKILLVLTCAIMFCSVVLLLFPKGVGLFGLATTELLGLLGLGLTGWFMLVLTYWLFRKGDPKKVSGRA